MASVSRQAIEANEGHKNALDAYANKLQTELLAVEKLIAAVEQLPEDETLEDPGDKWCLHVENAFKPTGIIDLTQTRHGYSPFYEESVRRDRYIQATVPNPFSNSEKRYLEKAIVKENKRLAAFRAKQSGQDAFGAVASDSDFFLNNINGIDWASVARDVSASNSPLGGRTAQECKVRWLGAQHPKINSGKWSEEEEGRLRELVDSKRDSRIDWEDISRLLGTNRTPLDCIRRYQAGSRPMFRWTKPLDKKLVDAVGEHGNSNWTLVANVVSPEVSANQCQIRYGRSLNPDIKRGKFTAEEDELLKQATKMHGLDWVMVAQAIPGRTNAQCRDRYLLLLTGDPLKAAWTDEEDTKLRDAVKKLGKHWEKVREEMGSGRRRTQYANRYKVLAQKEAQEAQKGAGQTSGGDTSVPVSHGGPSNELLTVVVEQEEAIQGASQGGICSTTKAAKTTQKTKVQKGIGAKRGRKKKVTEIPAYTDDHTPPGDESKKSIPKKRPRPLPRYRGRAIPTTSTDHATSAPVQEPVSIRNDAQEIPQADQASKEVEQSIALKGDRTSQNQQMLERAAASLAAELSDLTDLEDLEDAPPPKKKARSNVKIAKISTPIRTRKPRSEKPSAQKPMSSLPSRTIRTRSSTSNMAKCE